MLTPESNLSLNARPVPSNRTEPNATNRRVNRDRPDVRPSVRPSVDWRHRLATTTKRSIDRSIVRDAVDPNLFIKTSF